MNATFPSKSRAMLYGRCRFSVAVFVQVFIQVHFQHIVDDVGSHHQSGESGQRDELWWAEETGQLLVKLTRDAVSVLGQCPTKLHERLAFRVELQFVWILPPLDQNAAHVCGADQTVTLGGNRMCKDDRQPLAEEGLD